MWGHRYRAAQERKFATLKVDVETTLKERVHDFQSAERQGSWRQPQLTVILKPLQPDRSGIGRIENGEAVQSAIDGVLGLPHLVRRVRKVTYSLKRLDFAC
jgi:hypothetical protein